MARLDNGDRRLRQHLDLLADGQAERFQTATFAVWKPAQIKHPGPLSGLHVPEIPS